MNARFLWFGPSATIAAGWIPHILLRDYNTLPLHWQAQSLLGVALAASLAIALVGRHRASVPHWLLFAPVVCYSLVDALIVGSLISLLRPGPEHIHGWTLLGSAAIAWIFNLMCFTLWYWTLDFATRSIESGADLAFPGRHSESNGVAAYGDYFYLAFNTGLAFSTTDVSPLTTRMRFVLISNGGSAFLIVVLAAARAIGAM